MQKLEHRQSVEAGIKDIFSELLGVAVGDLDNESTFLSLGADSLLLLQASQRLQRAFGVKIPFRSLLEEHSTVEQLAAFLEPQIAGRTITSGLAQAPVSQPLPNLTQTPVTQQLPGFAQAPVTQQLPDLSGSSVTQPLSDLARASVTRKLPEAQNSLLSHEQHFTREADTYLTEDAAQAGSAVTHILKQQLSIIQQQLQVLQSMPVDTPAAPAMLTGEATQPLPAPGFPEPVHHGNNTSENMAYAAPEPATAPTSGLRVDPEAFVPYQPRRVARLSGLNERQKQHIDALIARHVKRTQKSKQRAQESRSYHADNRGTAGFNLTFKEAVYPLIIKHAQDAHIFDLDDNEYVDLAMGFGALLFGHSPSFLIEALEEQLKHGIGLGLQSGLVGKAAQLLCELTGMERASFCNSGTEAVMTAMRLARAVTGRDKVLVFTGAFHGTFDGVLVRGQETGNRPLPLAPGVTSNLVGDIILSNYGQKEAIEKMHTHAHELAAVLLELPQSRRPDFVPLDFIREMRALTADADIALIFDEVVTGFRSHPGGAQALFGVKADIATYGKAFGGGLPVAAIAGKAHYMAAVDGGVWNYGDDSYPDAIQTFFAGTYFKHPLLMPAVHAVLQHIKQSGPQLQERLNQRTEALTTQLDRFFEGEHVPVRIIRFGSLFRFSFPPQYKNIDANVFYHHVLENGVNLSETRNCFLSTAHTDEDIDHILWAVKDAFQQTRSGGFLADSFESSESRLSRLVAR